MTVVVDDDEAMQVSTCVHGGIMSHSSESLSGTYSIPVLNHFNAQKTLPV
jgi:hypothetical protein